VLVKTNNLSVRRDILQYIKVFKIIIHHVLEFNCKKAQKTENCKLARHCLCLFYRYRAQKHVDNHFMLM